MPQIRRIVKGGQTFKLATVKRDPFKQEYIDLCSSTFQEALGTADGDTLFEQVQSRGRHALERSEIIKAQSTSLGKQVDAVVRVQQASAGRDDGCSSDDEGATQQPAAAAAGTDEILAQYQRVLTGELEPLPLAQIFGAALAHFADETAHLNEDEENAPDAPDVGALIRMQAAPPSGMLLHNPEALGALMDLAVVTMEEPHQAGAVVSLFPPSHVLLAMVEPAGSDEEIHSEDEDDDALMEPSEGAAQQDAPPAAASASPVGFGEDSADGADGAAAVATAASPAEATASDWPSPVPASPVATASVAVASGNDEGAAVYKRTVLPISSTSFDASLRGTEDPSAFVKMTIVQ